MELSEIIRDFRKIFLLNEDVYLRGGAQTILEYQDRNSNEGVPLDKHLVILPTQTLQQLEKIALKEDGSEESDSANKVLDYVWSRIKSKPGEELTEVGNNLFVYMPQNETFDDMATRIDTEIRGAGINPQDRKKNPLRIISNRKSLLATYNRRGFLADESSFDKVDPALIMEGHIEVDQPELLQELKSSKHNTLSIYYAAQELGREFFEFGNTLRRRNHNYLYPNQIVEFTGADGNSEYAIVDGEKGYGDQGVTHIDDVVLRLMNSESEIPALLDKKYVGVSPRNIEQALLARYITDPLINMVIIVGGAGTGKTVMSYAASMDQVLHKSGRNPDDEKHQLIIAKSVSPIPGQEVGYLPGKLLEKVSHILGSFEDAHGITDLGFDLRKMMQEPDFDFEGLGVREDCNVDKEGKEKLHMFLPSYNAAVKFFPMAFARGRSVPDVIFYIDEFQNLTPKDGRTIIQRAGNNSKTLISGDIYQIDFPGLRPNYNALIRTIDHMYGHPGVALVRLTEIMRPVQARVADSMPQW